MLSAQIRISHIVVSTMPPPMHQPATAADDRLVDRDADRRDRLIQIVRHVVEIGAGRERLFAGPGQHGDARCRHPP